MKIKIIILLFLITAILPLPVFPQTVTGTINGVVRDLATGETMPGVNVIIEGTLRGASTDADGRFTIPSVTPGTCNLVFSFISYKPLRMEGVIVKAGSVTSFDAGMEDQSDRKSVV